MAKFKFEKLIIWQRSMDFGENVFEIIQNFPNEEKFNLSSQLLRASDSIALNISEGSIAQSNPEQRKFMGYAIRSLAEVITCLHKARRRNYIAVKQFDIMYEEAFSLMNMMNAFRKKIN